MNSDINMGNCIGVGSKKRNIRRFKHARKLESLMSNCSISEIPALIQDKDIQVEIQRIEIIPNKTKIVKKLDISQNTLYLKRKQMKGA